MLKEIENKINRINYTLVHHKLVLGRRYNYYALDLYIKLNGSMRETLLTGTKKKIDIYLCGLEKSRDLPQFLTGKG